MSLPSPPDRYSTDDQSRLREAIRQMFNRVRKTQADIELGPAERLIVRREGGARCRLKFNDDGSVETVTL